jgi:hypothetical protein
MTPLNRIDERGGSKLNLVLALMIMGSMLFTAYKLVPVYFAKYQFEDAIRTETRFATSGYQRKTAESIREDILQKAKELDIPVQPENVQASIVNGGVEINVDYDVPIDLAVYQWTLQVHLHADNHTI